MIEAGLQVGSLTLEWVGPTVHEEAWRIFEGAGDHVLSFCDCTSFVVANDHGLDFVFSFDSDFRTMGFDVRPGP